MHYALIRVHNVGMEGEKADLKGQIVELLKKNVALSSMVVIGLGLISYGLFEYKKPHESNLEFVSSNQEVKIGDTTTTPKIENISIDIQGEVRNPGVYDLPSGSRVADAIKMAGGLGSNSDKDYVSKSINQAQKLVDGQKIYIPRVGEEVAGIISAQTNGITDTSTGLVGINSASKGKLEGLPKIGPVTADKIISGRPYGNLEELVSKKIIGQKTYEAIKDQISLE